MPSAVDRDRLPGTGGFVPILAANLVPLVGVAQFQWDPATLVTLYALELLFSFPLAAVKALFAQRPPRIDADDDGSPVLDVSSDLTEKRGSVAVVSWLPPVYPRTVPFVSRTVVAAVQFVLVFGIVLSKVVDVTGVFSDPWIFASLAALVVGKSVETWRDYFDGGEYADASPYSVVETPARQAFFLTAMLVGIPFIVALGLDAVFVAIVAGKLLVEWSGYRADRDGGEGLTAWLSGPDAEDGARDPVSVPDGDPDARVRTDDRAVVATGALYVLGRVAPFVAMPFVIVSLLALRGLGSDVPPLLAVGATLLVAVVYVALLVAEVLEFYLQYGPLEYRRYGDRLVAFDTLVDEPQWATGVDSLRDVRVRQDRLADRLLGSQTVGVSTGFADGRTRRSLGPVADPDALAAAFDLPVGSTDLEPLDRLPVAAVALSLCGLVGAVVALAFDPSVAPTELVFGLLVYSMFGLPIVAIVLRAIWDRSYPESSG